MEEYIMKEFGVRELMILLMDVHKTKGVTTYTIPYQNINKFQQALENSGYKVNLNVDDFKNFQKAKPDTITFKNQLIDITITDHIFFAYHMDWKCSEVEQIQIKNLWYISNYAKDASQLTEIPSWSYFKYKGLIYECKMNGFECCSHCSFCHDKFCSCTHPAIRKCEPEKRCENKYFAYYELILPSEIMKIHDVIPQYYDLDSVELITSNNDVPTIIETSDKQFKTEKNMVDIDKFISKIPAFAEQQQYISKIDRLLKLKNIGVVTNISITYTPKNTLRSDEVNQIRISNFDLPQELIKEFCEAANQKMIEYKKKLENEVKDILLK